MIVVSRNRAYANIEEAKAEWIQNMLERKRAIPEPLPENKYSAKFVIRVPKSLHKLLVERSLREGISLNQLVANSLSYVMGVKHA